MAYDFNGGNYLTTASATASGSPMTIASFYRTAGSFGNDVIVSVGVNGGTHCNETFITNTGNFRATAIGATATGNATSPTTYSTNTQYHICGVFSSSNSRDIYVNGTSVANNAINIGTQNTFDRIAIGAKATTLAQILAGRVAEVGIWNAALTAAEIASLAKGMTCDKVRPQSLVFYAPLVRNLQDTKGGLTITNINGATVATHPRVYA
jgi:hypothetical protein